MRNIKPDIEDGAEKCRFAVRPDGKSEFLWRGQNVAGQQRAKNSPGQDVFPAKLFELETRGSFAFGRGKNRTARHHGFVVTAEPDRPEMDLCFTVQQGFEYSGGPNDHKAAPWEALDETGRRHGLIDLSHSGFTSAMTVLIIIVTETAKRCCF